MAGNHDRRGQLQRLIQSWDCNDYHAGSRYGWSITGPRHGAGMNGPIVTMIG
jgi:hypothetical protein